MTSKGSTAYKEEDILIITTVAETPREQADEEASTTRHMTNTRTEIAAALKRSTEQNGEHNRIRAQGVMRAEPDLWHDPVQTAA